MDAASCFVPSAASAGRGAVTAHSRLAVMQINENLDMGYPARSWQSESWPGLSWPSTSCLAACRKEGVDARDKRGHDGGEMIGSHRNALMRRRRHSALEHEFLDALAVLHQIGRASCRERV